MNKKVLLTLSFFFLFSLQSFAVSIMGADISYKNIGQKKYEVTFKFYRDCTGTNLGNLNYTVTSGSNSVTLSLTKKSIKDITPTCKTTVSACASQQSGLGIGTEYHLFKDTVNFNDSIYKSWISKGACEFRFSYGICCRNYEITTINSAAFYTDAMLNLCNVEKTTSKINSSPFMTIDPIAYLCCNNPYYFNNGALDTFDFDSLSYALIAPKSSVNTNIQHKSPFDPSHPMTCKCIPPGRIDCKAIPHANPPLGMYLNSSNGDLVFTPTKCDEVGLIVIEIKEWRKDSFGKYLHIGTTQRDIQLNVKNCGSNWPPSITSSKYDYTVCEGEEITIDIDGKDHPHPSDPNGRKDTVSMFWNGGLAGKGSFEVQDTTQREKKAKFTWKTKIGDAKEVPYTFIVQAKDDACPLMAVSSKAYSIKVLAKPISTKRTITTSCDKLYVSSESNVNSGYINHTWEVYDSIKPTTLVGTATAQTDSIVILDASTYFVKLTLTNQGSCPKVYWDTITINPESRPLNLGPDRRVMYHDSIILDATSGMSSYLWNDQSTGSTLKILGNEQEGFREVAVETVDNNGCRWNDTVQIEFNNCDANLPPTLTISKDTYNICAGETLTIQVNTNDAPPSQYPTGRYDTVTLNWLNPIPEASFKLLDSNSRIKTGILTYYIHPDSSLTNYSPNFIATDDGCTGDTRTKSVLIQPKSKAKGTFKNIIVCGEFNMEFDLEDGYDLPVDYEWKIFDESGSNLFFTSTSKNPKYTVTKDAKYMVQLTLDNEFNCQTVFQETVTLNAYKNKDILPTTAVLYKQEKLVIRPTKSQTYLWNDGSTADTLELIGKNFSEGNKRINLVVLGLDGCEYKDSMIVQVKCLPNQLDLGNNLTLDIWDSVTLKANKNFISYLWFNQSKQNQLKINGHLLGTGTHSIGLTAVDSFGCTYQDQVEITVTNTTDIQKTEPTKLQVYPSPTKKSITLELENGLNGATVYIYNVIGKLVLQKTLDANIENRHTFDIGAFPKGLYLIKVRKGEMEYTTKVVKE